MAAPAQAKVGEPLRVDSPGLQPRPQPSRRRPRQGAPTVSSPGAMRELEYTWGTTQAWLSQGLWSGARDARACAFSFPPLSEEVLKTLDECLDVAPTPDFILHVANIDDALVMTPLESCTATEQYLCDATGPYFECAAKVARLVSRSETPCWRKLTFATLAN